MDKIWQEDAWNDYLYWQTQDKKTLRKINALIKEIERNPDEKGTGKAERLKYDLAGYSSKRIDKENRLVYKINNGVLEIAECKTHYKKK